MRGSERETGREKKRHRMKYTRKDGRKKDFSQRVGEKIKVREREKEHDFTRSWSANEINREKEKDLEETERERQRKSEEESVSRHQKSITYKGCKANRTMSLKSIPSQETHN